jgi:hypothetical protein
MAAGLKRRGTDSRVTRGMNPGSNQYSPHTTGRGFPLEDAVDETRADDVIDSMDRVHHPVLIRILVEVAT